MLAVDGEVAFHLFESLKEQPHEANIKTIDAVRCPSFIDVIEQEDQVLDLRRVFHDQPFSLRNAATIHDVGKLFGRKVLPAFGAGFDFLQNIGRKAVNPLCEVTGVRDAKLPKLIINFHCLGKLVRLSPRLKRNFLSYREQHFGKNDEVPEPGDRVVKCSRV